MGKTLGQMTDEIRTVNVEKGWRPAGGGPGLSTWGDYWALINTEMGEMTEAFRDHRLADATRAIDPLVVDGRDLVAGRLPKPKGVGSEMADVLIRTLDTADVFGMRIDRDLELSDLADIPVLATGRRSFGDHAAWLHWKAGQAWIAGPDDQTFVAHLLRALVTTARDYQIDLDAEYERKIAYNRQRSFQHGGRTIAGDRPATRRAKLITAMPTDPREWWTGEEADAFIDEWCSLKLPKLTMGDGQGEHYLFWCVDPGRAAEMLGVQATADVHDGHFTIKNDYGYSATFVAADNEEETNSGASA